MTNMKTKNVRDLIADVVYQVMEEKKHSDTVLHQVLTQLKEETMDRSRIKHEAYGVIEQCILLDALIDHFSKTPVRKMKPWIRTALRIGAYEIRFMEQVPVSATCNEMVDLVSRHGYVSLKGFVNGVLRTLCREQDKVEFRDLAIQYSMPNHIVDLLCESYGRKSTKKILASYLEAKPLTIRVNESRISVEKMRDILRKQGINVEAGYYVPQALNLAGGVRVEQLQGYAEGYFVVQDESSMLPVMCSGIELDDTVMDLCAAPGGKTLQAAEYTGANGIVSSRDLTPYKVNKIQENVLRIGYENVQCKVLDGTCPDPEWNNLADVVIADVPCSGLGIIGRKPDIKYNITEEMMESLVDLQRQIVTQAVAYMKPDGVMMYSTCTLNPAENKDQVAWMVEHLGVTLESLDDYLPETLRNTQTRDGMLQILPGIQKSDGFFLARLKKSSK